MEVHKFVIGSRVECKTNMPDDSKLQGDIQELVTTGLDARGAISGKTKWLFLKDYFASLE